ncbi:hypothetical protein DFA_10936 [Cavenderia fasciculata]|uniref:Histone H2A n=1 Tax=Cavenderia fasciculata TaxID=261658 RepID=F4QBU0_CACFS|nr:uncharacterized protein DFA_10936 [Cavenderia fasciculata]EGG14678.1 hypothetical protein DFA_10936 [Cavenderia fasciculata]|eukprot:XP_004351186.1 hypothetical protein DFA_10936 [Cavenderia fasciculata]
MTTTTPKEVNAINNILKNMEVGLTYKPTISVAGMNCLAGIAKETSQRLINQSRQEMTKSNRSTIKAEDVKASVILLFNGDVAKMSAYSGSSEVTRSKSTAAEGNIPRPVTKQFIASSYRKDMQRDGLTKASRDASFFLAGVLQYVIFETIQLALFQAEKTRITPNHIRLAIASDSELAQSGFINTTDAIAHSNDDDVDFVLDNNTVEVEDQDEGSIELDEDKQ